MLKNVPGVCGYRYIGDKTVEFWRDPVTFIENRIEKHSSRIFQVRFLNNPTIFICSPQLIHELLTEKSSDFEYGYKSILHRVYGDLILFESEEDAMRLRLCMEPVFQDAKSCQAQLENLTIPFIEGLKTRESIMVYKEFKSLMTKVCLHLFLNLDPSTSRDACEEISRLATQHWHGIVTVPVSVQIPMAGRSTFSIALEAKEKLLDHIRISLSRMPTSQKDGDTLLSRLRNIAFPNDNDSLEQHLLLFVSAVIPKAFSSIITSFIVAMSGDKMKPLRERAKNDAKFLDDVLLEVERLWPPLFAARRLTKRTTSLGGFKIPKDYAVFYIPFAAHRDPKVFPDPNVFNPDRWTTCNSSSRHFVYTFGAGPRRCIGTKFIRDILLSVMNQLLRNYDWSLTPPGQNVTYKHLPVARPSAQVTVSFTASDQN